MRCNGAPDTAPVDEVRCAVGEEDDTAATAAADSSALDAVVFPEEELVPLADEAPLPKDGRSWGAGDGAMVMAVLIVSV